MPKSRISTALARIEPLIRTLRGQQVILDTDLARLYAVPTKRLNEAVRRNRERFPDDFMFQLTQEEVENLRCQSGTSNLKSQFASSNSPPPMRSQFATASKRNIRYLPYAFTDYGTLQAANVLNSPQAIRMSIFVSRAFFQMHKELTTTLSFAKRLAEIEKILLHHDLSLRDLMKQLRPLLAPPPEPPRQKIGFVSESKGRYLVSQSKPTKPSKKP